MQSHLYILQELKNQVVVTLVAVLNEVDITIIKFYSSIMQVVNNKTATGMLKQPTSIGYNKHLESECQMTAYCVAATMAKLVVSNKVLSVKTAVMPMFGFG